MYQSISKVVWSGGTTRERCSKIDDTMHGITFAIVHIRKGCPAQETTGKISNVHVEGSGWVNRKSIFHVGLFRSTVTNSCPSTVVYKLGFREVEREPCTNICSIQYIHLIIHHLLGGLATASIVITHNMNDCVDHATGKLTPVNISTLNRLFKFAVEGVTMMVVMVMMIRILVVVMSVLGSALLTPAGCTAAYAILPITLLVLELDVLGHIDDPVGCILVGSSCFLLGFRFGLLRGS